MTVDTPTPARLDQPTAEFFAVLSSPIRLAILQLLVHGERCVSDLVDALQITQPRLSNHLARLRACGFVTVRRQGTFMYYRLATPRLAEFIGLAAILAQPSADNLLSCSVLREERER